MEAIESQLIIMNALLLAILLFKNSSVLGQITRIAEELKRVNETLEKLNKNIKDIRG